MNWPVDYEETVTDDLRGLLSLLRSKFKIKRLLVEGGPTVNHALISGGLIDELFITLSPKLLAGDPAASPALLSGPKLTEHPRDSRSLNLLSAHAAGSEMFLRYSTSFR